MDRLGSKIWAIECTLLHKRDEDEFVACTKKRMRESVCYTTYGTLFDNMDERFLL